MPDGGLLRKSDVILITASMVAGAPRTGDLLILVAPPHTVIIIMMAGDVCGSDFQLQ